MALTSGTKQAQKEVKLAVMGLPETELTEERKKRLLKLFENGEMTNQVISAMPQTILDDPKAMEKIAESILSNSNYTDKIYSIVKSQEHFGDIFSKLDTEKKEKVAEVDALQKKIEILNSQIEDEKNGISTEEVKKLTEENEHLKDELNRHQVYLKLQDNVDNLKQEKSELENEYAQLIKMKDSVSVEIAKKVNEVYTNVAFDGALSSMMLREAAKFEESEKVKNTQKYILSKETCNNKSTIKNVKELVEFIYDELNNTAKREVSYNDVANILLCWSQSFLSIFAGEPGSGKTSLVSLMANIMGLTSKDQKRYAEIAVEKGWTSRRDFIGYYNPLTKTLDAANGDMLKVLEVMKAEEQEKIIDFPYLVLLDEANLSQMEHYWADFMGLCDMNKPQRSVSLGENYVYPIGDTLRFVATINLDHTTEMLSPRLIDRAWIILIQSSDILIDEIEEPDYSKEYPIVEYENLKQLCDSTYWKSKSLETAIIDKFNNIRTCFQYIGIRSSYELYEKKYRSIKGELLELYNKYSKVLIEYPVILNKVPEPTAVFLEIHHYRNTFQSMNLWFGREKDNIPHHNMVLQFSNADKIYEYYCLLGIVDILLELGFNEELEKRDTYKYNVKYTKFCNTEEANTFYFYKEQMKITLYYQPVIYSDSNKFDNNIGLFRVDKSFYTPDFILKKEKDGETTYCILDAKWRNRNALLKKENEGGLRDLVYKYSYSVVDKYSRHCIDNLWLLQGKDDSTNSNWYIHRRSPISKQKGEKFQMASGIVKYTPQTGSLGLRRVVNSFLSE